MGQAHLLPFAAGVHLVGEAKLHVVDQQGTAAGFGGALGGGQAVDGNVDRVQRRRGVVVARQVQVEFAVPVDVGVLHQAQALGLGRCQALAGVEFARRAFASHGLVEIDRSRWRHSEDLIELLDQQVGVESARRRALERFGMGRQQRTEEVFAGSVRPADQVQPLVEGAHQIGQFAQEVGPRRRATLGLHAHHQRAAQLA
mmetsp:Transcript_12873/g.30288  ORF Transcript_12873/g.30288 Transcript_12873/m.30288 type:complete len:200 (-) Transcript_12873:5171-5770(-)